MIKIRIGTFETNSSSTHTLCIATEEEWEKLRTGELLINLVDDGYITLEQALESYRNYDKEKYEKIKDLPREEILEELHADYVAADIEDYLHNEELESYEQEYTTPKGEKLHVFGLYGGSY